MVGVVVVGDVVSDASRNDLGGRPRRAGVLSGRCVPKHGESSFQLNFMFQFQAMALYTPVMHPWLWLVPPSSGLHRLLSRPRALRAQQHLLIRHAVVCRQLLPEPYLGARL